MSVIQRSPLSIIVCAFSFLVLLYAPLHSQSTNRIYFIGNSVTDGINYAGFQSLVLESGNGMTWARQMIPGAPLDLLWNSTSGFTQEPYGAHTNAFTNYTWDCISLQPYDREQASDVTSCTNFINEAKDKSPDIQFYIMSRWPGKPDGATADTYNQVWLGTYSGTYKPFEIKSYFEGLCTAVRAANSGVKPVLLVPVGDVFHLINQRAVQGQVGALSSIWDVYSDGIHMNGTGSYIVSCTFFATMYKQDPRGLSVPSNYGSISAATVTAIQQAVFDVVFTHAYSGATLDDLVPASGVSVDPQSLSLEILASAAVSATVAPSTAANKRVAWTSDNTGVAIVDAAGTVTGLSNGTAHVIARTNDGGFSDTCTVTVTGSLGGTTVSGVLASWEFQGVSATDSIAATTHLDGISTTAPSCLAVRGSGLGMSAFVGNGFYGSDQTAMNLTAAIAGTEYFSFTVTPQVGKLMSVESISINPTSQNRVRTFALFSSVNGFTEGQQIEAFASDAGSPQVITIDGLVNLPVAVEFRVYVYGAAEGYESVGIGNAAGADFVVNGSLLTPSSGTAPEAPTALSASQVKDISLYLSWTAPSGTVWGYNVYQGSTKLTNEPVRTTGYQVSGLTTGSTYTFTVKAANFAGTESPASSVLSVMTNRQPTASFTFTPLSGDAPLEVTVNADASTDPDPDDFILGFEWDFGDGSEKLNSRAPVHTYTQPGTYTITLRVMDDRGMYSEPVTEQVTVGGIVAARIPAFGNNASAKSHRVELFDLSGRKINSLVVKSLSELPILPGLSIITIDGVTVKRQIKCR